jgi:predicted porin
VLKWFALSSAAVVLPAQAQQSVQEIEIIGRSVNLVGDALSASEGRVSHDEILQRPILRTGDVLESVPGLVATQHSGSGKANQYFLRGFNLDHGTDFATSVDGMPVNMRSHGHGQGYTDLNFIIPELVEEIVYRKGSYYSDVGDFSGAGSARIQTRDHSVPFTIQLGAGEYGFARALLSGSTGSGTGELIYGLELQGYEGPWDQLDEDVEKTNFLLKQIWASEESHYSLSLMGYDNEWNSADQIPDRAVRSGLISKYGSIDTTVGGSSSRYSLSFGLSRPLAGGELNATAYAIDYAMDLYSNFSYFIAPEGDQFKQVDDRRIYGGELTWDRTSNWGDIPVTNTLGADLRVDNIDEVGLISTSARQFLGNIRLDAVDQSSLGFYWENELQWTDRLRTVLGLRHDIFDFEVNALAAADPSTLSANSGSNDADISTASLSIMYALNENHELYASIGEGFHSNDARGTTISRDPLTGDTVAPVDPLVATEGAEIGWRIYFNDRLNATLALWQLDIDSELLFVGDAGNTEDTGVGSERQGFELTAYYQLNDMFGLDLEYSNTDAKFASLVDGSDEIPGAMDEVISAGINFQPNDQFFAHLRHRQFADYPLDGGARAAGSSMTNLRLGYEVNDSLQLSLDVLNLFDSDDHDVEYFYESQLAGESAPVGDNHYHVFEPRAVRFYLQYGF